MQGQDMDTVTFWDEQGEAIVSISSQEIDSNLLVDIFDTPAVRAAIEKACGRRVDNTSEENSGV